MGFFGGLMKGLSDDKSDREIYEMENDEDDEILSSQYRKTGLKHTSSNRGWYKCIKCGKSFREGDMDIDHIIPKKCGGTNASYNLQCICKHCNRSKQADTSETQADLQRRKRELEEEKKEDLEYMKMMRNKTKGG